MRPSDVHISTITLSRSEQETEALKASLQALAALELPIVVADGGSPQPLVDFVAHLPGVSLAISDTRGLVPQVKASLRSARAAGQKFILYTEPDKQSFFEQSLLSFIIHAPDADDVGIVVAARTEESLQTFPQRQQLTERAINQLTGQFLGQPGDYSYGPFLIHRSLIPALEKAPESVGWGWRHFLFAQARKRGLKVVLGIGNFTCPLSQAAEGEREKAYRLSQLDQNIQGLLTAARS